MTVLAEARAVRTTIRDLCTLEERIDWRLGQRYWQARGRQSFLADAAPVPYTINTDGDLWAIPASLQMVGLCQHGE